MYLLKLVIIPTGSLIFRRIPFATTVFPTYPFAPPTALAGFLRRLVMLANGLELPGDIIAEQGSLNDNAKFYTLPRDYFCLGAYPETHSTHRTKRHQPWGADGKFNHTKFSTLFFEDNSEDLPTKQKNEVRKWQPQIPIWEYLHAERMTGYVVHEQREPLEKLRALQNWGSKLGKEGYAFIESMSEIVELQGPQWTKAKPATPVPAEALDGEPADFFTLYAYEWQKPMFQPAPESAEGVPGKDILIKPFLAAWVRREIELEYYTDGKEYFPTAWINKLKGGA